MKTTAKSVVGVLISIAWILIYVGGGGLLLAHRATANINHVSPYIPVVIFLWIVGFFIGHAVIEKFCLYVFSLISPRMVESLPAPTAERTNSPTTISESYEFANSSINGNIKKSTCKIYLTEFNLKSGIYFKILIRA